MWFVCLMIGEGHMSQVMVSLVVFSHHLHRRDAAAIHEQYRWMSLSFLMPTCLQDSVLLHSQQLCRRLMCRTPCLRRTPVPVLVVRPLLCHQVAYQVTVCRWWISPTQPATRKLKCWWHHVGYLPGNVRDSKSYSNFLSKLKTHYFNIAFYNHIIC